MAIQLTDHETEARLTQFKLRFLEKTGYSDQDLLAWNAGTGKFSMRNGGLYQMSEGGDIEHISGPSPDPEDRI